MLFLSIYQDNKAQDALKSSGAYMFSGYYGTTNKIGVDFIFAGKTKWGFGVSTHIGKSGIGASYSKTMGPSKFPDDIYETITSDVVGIYGMLGVPVSKKLTILGKLGASSSSNFYNAYDKFKILSNNGYYYTSTDAGTNLLIGATCVYSTGNLSPYLSFDSFSGLGIGVIYSFNSLK